MCPKRPSPRLANRNLFSSRLTPLGTRGRGAVGELRDHTLPRTRGRNVHGEGELIINAEGGGPRGARVD